METVPLTRPLPSSLPSRLNVPELAGLAPGYYLQRVPVFNCETGAARDWQLVSPHGRVVRVDGLGYAKVRRQGRVGLSKVLTRRIAAMSVPWLPPPATPDLDTAPWNGDIEDETLANLTWASTAPPPPPVFMPMFGSMSPDEAYAFYKSGFSRPQ